MHNWWRLWALSTLVGLQGVAFGASERARVVVVTPPSIKDAAFAAQVRAVDATLNAQIERVPLADYVRAGRALGAGALALYGDETAVMAGRVVGATHVLLLKPAPSVRSGRHSVAQWSMLMVDVATGESVVDETWPLTRSSANAAAQKLTAAVLAAVAGPALVAQGAVPVPAPAAPVAKAAPAAEAKATPVPVPVPAPVPAPAAPAIPADAPPSVAKAAPPPSAVHPAAKPAPAPAEVEGPAPPAAVLEGPEAPAPLPALVPPPSHPAEPVAPLADRGPSYWDAEGRTRYGITVSAGALLYERVANLDAGGVTQVQYGGQNSGRAPMFARGVFDLQLAPATWHRGRLNALSGLLVFFHGEGGPNKTATASGSVTTLASYRIDVGAGFRAPLWRGPRATALQLRLGYSQYGFESDASVPFVPVGVRGLLLAVGAEVPLGTPHVALVATAGLVPNARPFGGTQTLGASLNKGLGGTVDGGLRFAIGPIDLYLLGHWQRFALHFAGSSQAANLQSQYTDVALSDQSVGGRAQLGVHF